jgi:DNA-binding IclR family transcriptional regulator
MPRFNADVPNPDDPSEMPASEGEPEEATDKVAGKEDRLFIAALARGLKVLETFPDGWAPKSLSEIARAAGIPVPAAQRSVHTLTRLGYLTKDDRTRRYRLSPKALDGTYHFLTSSPLYEAAIPVVVALRDEWRETVNISLLHGAHAVVLIRMPGARRINPSSLIGRRMWAHGTSTGLAMLSRLPVADRRQRLTEEPLEAMTPNTITDPERLLVRLETIREQGYALVDEEASPGELSVAAPIIDGNGTPVAAIGVTTATAHWTAKEAADSLGPAVIRAARAITDALKGWQPW